MPLQLLLLLTLLGPGSSLQLWETWEDEAKESPGPLLARRRRQVAEDEDEDVDTYSDYGTDPPEVLENSIGAVSLSPKLQALMGTLGQRESAEPGTPEPATLEVATGDSAGLGAGGASIGNMSTEVATPRIPVTLGPLTKELVTTIPPIMGAPSTELATIKALFTEPAGTEVVTTQPAATEALTMKSTIMEALSVGPVAMEALTTQLAATEAPTMKSTVMEALSAGPVATEALTTQPAATEAPTMKSTVMEALSTGPADTAAPPMEPTTTEATSTDPATMKAPSTLPATTRSLTIALPVLSDPLRATTVSVSNSSDGFINQKRNTQGPQSSVAPSFTGGPDYISVKQCLLAILILALVATIFLVCTVVLAVRLSRKTHMYPVRSYSPTEMVCISSLLPEGGEGPTATANGSLRTKRTALKEGPREDREGDDLTLHSFLP